jgi:hypothetical protein
LDALVFREEAGRGDIVVEFPVNERRGDDGDEAYKEEDTVEMLTLVFCSRGRTKKLLHLPRTYMLTWDMAQAVA